MTEISFGSNCGSAKTQVAPSLANLFLHLFDTVSTWQGFGADGDRSRRLHAVTMLEILIGIVEDDEGLVLHRLDRFLEFGIERIEIVDQFFVLA